MSNSYDLSKISKKIAKEHRVQLDGALAQYVKSGIELLQSQAKDITEYTLTQIHPKHTQPVSYTHLTLPTILRV